MTVDEVCGKKEGGYMRRGIEYWDGEVKVVEEKRVQKGGASALKEWMSTYFRAYNISI